MDCNIKLLWDSDAKVWIATSDDIRGLVLESGSFDALIERVKIAVEDLLSFEDDKPDYCDLRFISERRDRVLISGGI
ncbi:MAG: DUF1902 domain-containing protein [Synergistaceae bacterium]|nr:DUF1902 domain-containing protein [Synergistaceae bacterium]MBQ3450131.1 DUF1902 domain-containing protein [Synergistaceae bacterium]MBQ3693447.1 DUF1902 domain-containing protein [Synergistaceae bacterium]MBR0069726.1 DUF1902 domain-containing protein [Synergistaceae bacterium]